MTVAVFLIFTCAQPYAAELPDNTGLPFQNPVLAKGVLLVAGKDLRDPNFEKTVVLITEYNDKGTAGLVLNRHTKIPATQALPELANVIPEHDPLYIGGPVAANSINLLIRSDKHPESGLKIIDGISLINTLSQLNQLMLDEAEPESHTLKLFTGIAGWAPGQLESELIRGDWHLWHATIDTVFNTSPENLWYELIQAVTAIWVKGMWTGSS